MAGHRIFPQLADRTWLFTEYVVRERSAVTIAKDLGCSDRAVGVALEALGIDRRPRGGASVDRGPDGKSGALARSAARALLGTTGDDLKAPPLRPLPSRANDVLVVRVDLGWASAEIRMVLLVEPGQTFDDLGAVIVGHLFDDRSHLGMFSLPPGLRIRRWDQVGYYKSMDEAENILWGFDDPAIRAEQRPEYEFADDVTVTSRLGKGCSCWFTFDLGDQWKFAVRVLAAAPADHVIGLGAAKPQTIYRPLHTVAQYPGDEAEELAEGPSTWKHAIGDGRIHHGVRNNWHDTGK